MEEWPQLMYLHGKDMENQTFCSMNKRCRVSSVAELRGKKVWTCCHGWLVLSNVGSFCPLHLSLWNPITFETIYIPSLLPNHAEECVLTSAPSNPTSALILLDNVANCFWVFQIHLNRWSKTKYDNSTVYNNLQNPVYCNDKLYAVTTNQDLVDFTQLSAPRILIPLPRSKEFGSSPLGYFLIDSCGELFVVASMYENGDGSIMTMMPHNVTRFEVYKLDLPAPRWERVMTLKDRAFFYCRDFAFSCSTSVCSGIRGNHIYFTVYDERCLYSYDIEEETISISLPCPSLPTTPGHPVWVMPDIRLRTSSGYINEKEEQGTEEEKKNLQLVPESMSRSLNFISCGNSGDPKCRPFLLQFKRSQGCLSFVDPENGNNRRIVEAPQLLKDATICDCKDGWLLMCKLVYKYPCYGKYTVNLFNPFTEDLISYPDLLLRSLSSSLFDFSFHPQRCVIAVVTFFTNNSVGINISRSPKQEWIHIKPPGFSLCKEQYFRGHVSREEQYFRGHVSREEQYFKRHVYCEGAFYFLDPSGKVGVLTVQEGEEEVCKWRVLEETQKTYLSYCECFLAECDGDLYSVFVRDVGVWVMVFKLDRTKMIWNRVESLGKHTMYISQLSSLLIESQFSEKENTICFPRFYGEKREFVSYSLTTRKYCHSSGTSDYYDTSEPLLCCWIRPS